MRRRALDVAARARVACSSTLARANGGARAANGGAGGRWIANARYSTKTFADVVPGSTLRVESDARVFRLEVYPHETETEALEVEVADDAHDGFFEIERRPSRDERECEEFVVRDVRAQGGGDDAEPVRVTARVPPRFCGLEARLRGENSDVFVESIVEAAVKVRTNGGWVGLGSIKGSTLDVETNGGDVRARGSVSADSRVRTSGGSIDMKGKFVGSIVYVDTEPDGAFRAQAVFGDKVNVNTGGGDASAKSLRVSEFGLVRTSGGNITIDSLEGAGEEMIGIDSGGGDVSVKFGERVHIVHVNSRGGAIEASFPNGFTPAPHVIGEHGGAQIDDVVVLPDADRDAFASSTRTNSRLVHNETDEIARKVAAAAEGSCVTIDATDGVVRLSTTSWLQSALGAAKS